VLPVVGEELAFSPEEDQLTAKVNPQTDTLLLKVVKGQSKEKLLRGVPLPPNLRLQHLRVKVLPRGEVVVKAPYLLPGELPLSMSYQLAAEENSSLPMPNWIPVRVSWQLQQQDQLPLPSSAEMRLARKGSSWGKLEEEDPLPQHFHKQGKKIQSTGGQWFQEQNEEDQRSGSVQDRDETTGKRESSSSLSHLSEEQKMSKLLEKMLRPQYLREEVNGEEQVSLVLKVNALGFSPEEVIVRVIKEESVLIVEAVKDQQKQKVEGESETKKQLEESGVAVKSLRREFVLSDDLDVSRIGIRKLQSGLVIITLPLVKNKETKAKQQQQQQQQPKSKKNKNSRRMNSTSEEDYSDDFQKHQSREGGWEKPIFG
jgi:NACalpha-BTF3-like transcription factor